MSVMKWQGAVALLVATLFALEVFGAVAGARSPEGGASARGDDEPNDQWESAGFISDGEVVAGTLITSASGDTQDWYKIDVPYGKVLNASLYMVDYNANDYGEYNFQLTLANLDSSWTVNRWENVIGVQYWYPYSPATMYLQVIVNYTDSPYTIHTLAGRYTLSATISDPLVYNAAPAAGSVDVDSSHGRDLYRLDTPPGDDQLMRARLACPVGAVFSLSVYNVWPTDGSLWMRNGSWVPSPGAEQSAVFSGLGGAWYIKIGAVVGSGTYTLSTEYAGQAMDGDNFPPGAKLINDLYPHLGYADEGVDWVDWWKVDAKAGRPISEAYLTFVNGMYEPGSYFHLQAYTKDIEAIKGDWMPQQTGGAFARLSDVVVGYDGPVYFAVRALASYAAGSTFVPARGWYKLTLTLPNDPPQYSGGIPEIHLNEDGTDESLLLSTYITDADNDTLAFTVVGNYHCRARVNATTGLVNITPEPDWYGSERVRFRATDSGPGNKWIEVNTSVFVDPVNDAPYLRTTIDDIFLNEEQEGRTPDISLMFGDIDDPAENLTFGIRVVSQQTHPPAATIPTKYDATRHLYRLGPATLQFGTYQLEVNCTDGRPGTVPAATRFNLTITHKNHNPGLVIGADDPAVIEVREHGTSSQLLMSDFFTDPDLPADYANDTLTYAVTGMHGISANVTREGRLFIDTGTEQYYPGATYQERLLITAKDRFGKTATLNVTVNIIPVDDPPLIMSFQPDPTEVSMNEGAKETFRLTAADNDTPELTYAWYLDGVRDTGKGGTVLTYLPDFLAAGAHTIKVTVSDGTTTLSMEWTVTVKDINRPPTASIKYPVNYTKFKKGAFTSFTAEATDPDGDNLTYIWRDAAGNELGRGTSVSTTKLEKGQQTIRLEVSDGKVSVYKDVIVVIYPPAAPAPSKGFIPGYSALAVMAAAAGSMLVVASKKRRPL